MSRERLGRRRISRKSEYVLGLNDGHSEARHSFIQAKLKYEPQHRGISLVIGEGGQSKKVLNGVFISEIGTNDTKRVQDVYTRKKKGKSLDKQTVWTRWAKQAGKCKPLNGEKRGNESRSCY